MEQDSAIQEEVNRQLGKFCNGISAGLKKPKRRLIHQMIYGIQASRDVKVSEVARSLNETIKLLKTEIRLCRNLRDETLTEHINHKLLKQAKNKINKDTVLALDLTSIEKPYAKKMDFLARVWSGMKKDTVTGYYVLEIIGADVYDEKLLPVYSKLYSQNADKFKSENDQILEAVDKVNAQTRGNGIYVIGRGGDRRKLIEPLISKELRFVIRLKGDRLMVLGNNRQKTAEDIAIDNIEYKQKYKVEIDNEGFKEKKEVELGVKRVRMSGIKDELWLVAARGFGNRPMVLLTNVKKDAALILEMYFTRWKVEESIRFLKQEYNLEDVRVRNYAALKNTVALLSAVFYFLSVYLRQKARLKILISKIYKKAKRFFEMPAFKHYAVADGIFRLLFNCRWKDPWEEEPTRQNSRQLLLFPAVT